MWATNSAAQVSTILIDGLDAGFDPRAPHLFFCGSDELSNSLVGEAHLLRAP